jgi:hypothetical protein
MSDLLSMHIGGKKNKPGRLRGQDLRSRMSARGCDAKPMSRKSSPASTTVSDFDVSEELLTGLQ